MISSMTASRWLTRGFADSDRMGWTISWRKSVYAVTKPVICARNHSGLSIRLVGLSPSKWYRNRRAKGLTSTSNGSNGVAAPFAL